MLELEEAYKEMQNEGIEIGEIFDNCGESEYEDLNKEVNFLDTKDGQTLERIYKLAYGYNNIHNNKN